MKHGLVLGKFMPPHNGHLHLIDSSSRLCDILHIMVCYKENDEIPGKNRYEWLRKLYSSKPNVIIHDIPHNHPNYPKEANSVDEFYDIWVKEVYKHIHKLDIVFTSTDYGEEFASYLDVEHILIGSKFDNTGVCRDIVPVSGTDIRNSCFDNWNFIPDVVKPYFIKKIVIVGPECSGKTTLSDLLSKYYKTKLIPEYARIYMNEIDIMKKSREKFTLHNISHIASGQIQLEDELIPKCNKIAICDTDIILTQTWSDLYFGKCPEWIIDESYKRQKDLYLLMDTDFDWEDDGTREFPDDREWHFCRIKQELDKRELNYKLITGNIIKRVKDSIKEIDKLIN